MFNKLKLIIESTEHLKKAQDPATDSDLLATYTAHPNLEIQKAAMSNPNTPFENLAANAGEHPKEFTENPILPLYALENPNWLDNISSSAVHSLINHNSDFWLNKFLNSPNYMHKRKAASHPKIGQDDIENIFKLNNTHWNTGLASNPNTSPEILDKLADTKNSNVLFALAERSDLSPELYKKLYDFQPTGALTGILAANKGVPVNLLHDIFRTRGSANLHTLANNKNTDSKLLDKIVKHPHTDQSVIHSVLTNPNVSSETIHNLALDNNPTTHFLIADHQNTAPETLDLISKNNPRYDSMQATIAQHPNVSLGTLKNIYKNPNISAATKSQIEKQIQNLQK